jgi:tetratricopeptide (TPR) repeat protein
MDWSCYERVNQLQKSGRVEEAIQECDRLLTRAVDDDERASLLNGELICYAILGRMGEARRVLGQMQQLHPSEVDIRLSPEFCGACLLLQEGKFEEGISALAAMLQRYGGALKEERFRYLYEDIQCRRALALVGISRFADALPILKEAVSFSFNQATDEQQTHFNLGICCEETKDLDAAKREYLIAVGFNIKNDIEEQARWRLALLFYTDGALAQARKQLEVILQEVPDQNAVIPRKWVYQQLSMVSRYLGDKANAKIYMDLAKAAPEETNRRNTEH